MIGQEHRAPREYLFVPEMPTPNGGLHLGHISGPYLVMDVLARALRRLGHRAAIVSGSDVYESYVTQKARQTGWTPEEVCRFHHQRILGDLAALRLDYDLFLDPLDPEHDQAYGDFHQGALAGLAARGLTEVRPERFLYSPSGDKYLVGCWISGRCPVCGTASGSFLCEQCGTHYRPMDLLEPRSTSGEQDLETIDDASLYLDVGDPDRLLSRLDAMELSPEFRGIAETYLAVQGPRIRLTHPGRWGLSHPVAGSRLPQVVFTYTALYLFSLYCAGVWARKTGRDLHPFAAGSEVVTAASFGIDNAVPYLVGAVALGLHGPYRPFDHFFTNYFYQLEEAKFSTSRGHLVWAADIVEKTPAPSDAVRYYLCRVNPSRATNNFDLSHFLDTVNRELAGRLQGALERAWQGWGGALPGAPATPLLERLERRMAAQTRQLEGPVPDLAQGLGELDAWLDDEGALPEGAGARYWWLKGVAWLAWPYMPDCAGWLWQRLHGSGIPSAASFPETGGARHEPALPRFFPPLTFAEIAPCLPPSVARREEGAGDDRHGASPPTAVPPP